MAAPPRAARGRLVPPSGLQLPACRAAPPRTRTRQQEGAEEEALGAAGRGPPAPPRPEAPVAVATVSPVNIPGAPGSRRGRAPHAGPLSPLPGRSRAPRGRGAKHRRLIGRKPAAGPAP